MVQIAKIVPVKWLHDYLELLRVMRNSQPVQGLTEEQLQHVKEMDAAADVRIAEVSAYLQRLDQPQLN